MERPERIIFESTKIRLPERSAEIAESIASAENFTSSANPKSAVVCNMRLTTSHWPGEKEWVLISWSMISNERASMASPLIGPS